MKIWFWEQNQIFTIFAKAAKKKIVNAALQPISLLICNRFNRRTCKVVNFNLLTSSPKCNRVKSNEVASRNECLLKGCSRLVTQPLAMKNCLNDISNNQHKCASECYSDAHFANDWGSKIQRRDALLVYQNDKRWSVEVLIVDIIDCGACSFATAIPCVFDGNRQQMYLGRF